MYYNENCLDSCPEGYAQTAVKGCALCNSSSEYYYNHTCVTNCPLTTFPNSSVNYCQPCYVGCATCANETQYACSSCTEGFFYRNNACWGGCPPDMYSNTDTNTCQECHPDCMTCSQPNEHSCTACHAGYYLFDGTCVASCPTSYYKGYLGELGVIQVPACLPKLVLTFSLSLTMNSRIININFNYGIVYLILAISQRIQVEISNTRIESTFFVLSPLTESSIEFQYLGDHYYPPDSLLSITIDLDSDFNNDPYSRFLIFEKTHTIELKEIYPFTKTEIQFISSSTDFTKSGGSTIATAQTVSSVAQGAATLSLIRLQMAGDIIQLMRFIDIRWPPSVVQFFETSHIDPTSMVLPIDFVTAWNDQLDDRNSSMPRIFGKYETSPFFTINYNNELSNLFLWGIVVISAVLMINILNKKLPKVIERLSTPKTRSKRKKLSKPNCCCIRLLQKLERIMKRIDGSTLLNFLIMFLLSIFMIGNFWALINIRYSTTLVESSTAYTALTLTAAIFFFCFYLMLEIFITKVIWKQLPHVLGVKESLRPIHLKRYRCLFEEYECQKRAQVFFVPLLLLRSIIFVMVLSLLCPHGIAQTVLIWVTDLAFLIYSIIYKPLKGKWMMRITLLIEILVFGCVTLAFTFSVLGDVDAVTLNELGFAFIALSIGATFSEILISLIQVLELVMLVYSYIKSKLNKRRNEVHPISSSSSSVKEIRMQEIPEFNTSEKTVDLNSEKSPTMFESPLKNAFRLSNLLKEIGDIPPKAFEETPAGEQFLDNVESWLKTLRSAVKPEIDDASQKKAEVRQKRDSENRIILIEDL